MLETVSALAWWASAGFGALTVAAGLPVLRVTLPFLFRYRRLLADEAEMLARVSEVEARGAGLPDVVVQIPAYNEARVIEGAIDAAASLRWPRERLHVQVLDDSTDTTTALAERAAARWTARGIDVRVLHRGDRTGFKAGALAAGVAHSEAPYFAVFDADFRPPVDWLMRCMTALLADPGLAFVQGRVDFANRADSWITRGQSLYLDTFYVCEQGALQLAGRPVPFNGTCGIWRREAIADAGGWSGATITEDFDLSVRAFGRGWRSRCLITVAAEGELPRRLGTWLRQQDRWIVGIMQTLRLWAASPGEGLAGRLRPEVLLRALEILALPCIVLSGVFAALGAAASWQFAEAYGPFLICLAALVAGALVVPALCVERIQGRRGAGTLAVDLAYAFVLMVLLALRSVGSVAAGLFGRRARVFVRTPKTGAAPAPAPIREPER